MLGIFKPASFKKYIAEKEIESTYRKLRIQMMITIFIGYAGYYLVRQNFYIAVPYLIKEGLSPSELGIAVSALPFSYGVSKFLMGIVSDRSNARVFLATGIVFSSIISMLIPFITNVKLIILLMILNGMFQGMGWPACGRVIAHWFSDRERGTKMAIWNTSHNLVGGIIGPIAAIGISLFGTWKSIFYFPAILAIAIGILCLIFMRDTPQSCGLPPIEEFNNDYSYICTEDKERELTTKEILFQYVLNNKYLWCLAIANIFVYAVRYGILNWCVVYLTTVKGASPQLANWCYSFYEYAGIPGILFSGWLSDKVFKGRRGPISTMCMALVTATVMVYWMNPAGNYTVDIIALFITGLLIYIPVFLVGVAAIDIVPKKAAGTAAGFTGLFGYLFGTVLAGVVMGRSIQYYGWASAFMILIIACVLGTVFLSMTWNLHDREKVADEDEEDYLEEI